MMFKYMCLVLFITWYQLADGHPAKSNVQSLDSMIEKESEAFLSAEAEQSSQKNVRGKRTIGFLRQLFPNLSQIIDRKIQQITRFVFRVIGRLVLRGGAAGGTNGGGTNGGGASGGTNGGSTGNGRRISITLPTYPPSADDDDEEQTEVPAAATDAPLENRIGSGSVPSSQSEAVVASTVSPMAAAATEPVAIDSAPAASADVTSTAAAVAAATTAAAAADDVTTNAAVTTTTSDSSSITTATVTTTVANVPAATAAAATSTNAPTTTQPPSDADNAVGNGIVKRTARDVSDEETGSAQKLSSLPDTGDDAQASSSDNSLASKVEADDAQAETTEDDPRNKRFLLNLSGGGGQGSGGGSGNFLFDLIRLIAGSGANQDKDESNIAPIEGEAQELHADINAKEDGYNVGVPGPLTRIFVIANRGVANLVQDLILRLAQTTERIVNFKARLITSLI